MLALRKRRPHAADLPQPEPIAEVEHTPLTLALQRLVSMALRDGVVAAAEALQNDPDMLAGLADAMLDADTQRLAGIWDNAQQIRAGQVNGLARDLYSRTMAAMGLTFCESPTEFLPMGLYQRQPENFRVTSYVHPTAGELPVIMVGVFGQQGQLAGAVLLFVAKDWSGWVDVEPRTKILGRVEGLHLAFRRCEDSLAVSPSFETAGRLRGLGGVPLWVTITPDNLARHFVPPDTIRRLFLLHGNPVEREAVLTAATRLEGLGFNEILLVSSDEEIGMEHWPAE